MKLTRLGYRGHFYDIYLRVGLDASSFSSLIVDGQRVTVLYLEAVNPDRAAVQCTNWPEVIRFG